MAFVVVISPGSKRKTPCPFDNFRSLLERHEFVDRVRWSQKSQTLETCWSSSPLLLDPGVPTNAQKHRASFAELFHGKRTMGTSTRAFGGRDHTPDAVWLPLPFASRYPNGPAPVSKNPLDDSKLYFSVTEKLHRWKERRWGAYGLFVFSVVLLFRITLVEESLKGGIKSQNLRGGLDRRWTLHGVFIVRLQGNFEFSFEIYAVSACLNAAKQRQEISVSPSSRDSWKCLWWQLASEICHARRETLNRLGIAARSR